MTNVAAGQLATGVTMVVVPNGFRERAGRLFCRLSLSVVPTLKDKENKAGWVGTVDVTKWPEEIYGLTQSLQIIVQGGEKIDCKPDLEVAPYLRKSTCLWQRIFADGTGTLDEGFGSLLKVLDPTLNTVAAKPVKSAPAAALSEAIERINGSLTAASLLQRIGHHVLSRNGNVPAISLADVSPVAEFWRMFSGTKARGDEVREKSIDTSSRKNPHNKDGREGSARNHVAPHLRMVNHLVKPAGWKTLPTATAGEDRRSSEEFMKHFHELHERYLESLPIADTDKTTTEFTPVDAARRKLAGIMSCPTLAKYLGLIVDTEVDVDCLVAAAASPRVYGKIAAVSKLPMGSRFGITALENEIPWTAFVIGRTQTHRDMPRVFPLRGTSNGGGSWSYEYFGPQQSDEATGRDGLLRLGADKRFVLQTPDLTNAAILIYDQFRKIDHQTATETDKNSEALLLKQSAKFPELRSRGIVLRDSMAQEQKLPDRDSKTLYAEHLFVGYRIDVAMAPRPQGAANDDVPPVSACLDRKRWRTLTARDLGYGRDIDKRFLRAVHLLNHKTRDDGHVRPMTRTDDQEKHQELFAWTGESLAIPHITESDQERVDCSDRGDHDSINCSETKRLRMLRERSRERRKGSRPMLFLCPGDLTVDLDYDLPTDPYRKPLPLREGRGYVFGARIVFLNGCSIDFDQAVGRYIKEKDCILGTDQGQTFVYRRSEKVNAPSVLLRNDDKMVTASDGARDSFAGETINDVVVRSGVFHNDSAQRLLVPPRVSFDLAEQGGCFDTHCCEQPPGAFTTKMRARFDKKLGVFPVARGNGTLSFPSDEDPCETQNRSRGSVFVVDPKATPSDIKFYPDPMARQAGVCFSPEKSFANRFKDGALQEEFWSRSQKPEDALPIVLEVKKARAPRGKLLGWFDSPTRGNPLSSKALRRLTVVLAPGASVCLHIFSIPSGEYLAKHSALACGVAFLRELHSRSPVTLQVVDLAPNYAYEIRSVLDSLLVSDNELSSATCEDLLSLCSLDQVSGSQSIRVTHAVDRPAEPRFFFNTSLRNRDEMLKCVDKGRTRVLELSLYPVVITVNSHANQSSSPGARQESGKQDAKPDNMRLIHESWDAYVDAQELWKNYVDENGALIKETFDETGLPIVPKTIVPACMTDANLPRLHRRLWQSQEGGSIAFFTGELLVDRLTTGSLRCDANWKEYSPSAVVQVKGKRQCYSVQAPPRSATLFRIDDIENLECGEKSGRHDKLDLLRKCSQNLRYLAYSFPNGRARRLSVRLVATSRFSHYYPDPPARNASVPAASDFATLWIPATFRPDVPQVDRILPVFHWTTEVHDGGKETTWKRECSLRVYLGRDWFSSGEGEQLALVCWPNNLFSSNPDESARQKEEAQSMAQIGRCGMSEIDPLAVPSKDCPSANTINKEHPFVKYGQFVTRWGADPIRLSGPLTEPMSADRFDPFEGRRFFKSKVTRNLYNQDLLLRLPESATPADSTKSAAATVEPLPVCILTHDVCLDPDEGRWFADIAIDHGASYFPFVQMGLARYQAHSTGGLELSYPVPAFVQIPPRRQGRVAVVDDYTILLELSGVGFYRSDVGPKDKDHQGDLPTIDVRLLAEAPSNSVPVLRPNWRIVTNYKGKAVEFIDTLPIQRGPEVVWNLKIELPKGRTPNRLGLLIEEFEHMGADKFTGTDASGNPAFKTDLVKRGPLFSHIVDLGQLALACNRSHKNAPSPIVESAIPQRLGVAQ